jgi:hypothetical protein|tara:strand:+ start:427 stop:615 length:189 start_codon:yes stop_codon:yes gene_type:complete
MDFLFGMLVGALSVVLAEIAYFIVNDKKFLVNHYNNKDGKTLEDMVDSEYDPENYFKPEGTA